jgi:cardiolipin synthase
VHFPQKETTQVIPEDTKPASARAFSIYTYIPNTLTIFRLLGTPIIVWAIAEDRFVVALWLFFTISVTDWLDGYLARRWSVCSKVGQILDPLADKFLLISVYLVLGLWGFAPMWLTVLVLTRDLLILAIGGALMLTRKDDIRLPPQLIGKISTSLQMLFIGCVLAGGVAVPSIPTSSIQNFLMVSFVYVVALTTILSGISYAKVVFKAIHKS